MKGDVPIIGEVYDDEELCRSLHPNDEIVYVYTIQSLNNENVPKYFKNVEDAIQWAKDIYGCDGLNEDCYGNINFDNVNWFNSGLGFCDCCHKKLFSKIGDREEYLYTQCEANDGVAVEEVVSMTK